MAVDENVLPAPTDQPAQTPAVTPPAPEPIDLDEIELREAMAAAEAEKAAPKPTPTDQPTGAAAATPTAVPSPDQPRGKPGLVPPERFNEVNELRKQAEQRATKAEQEAAYLRGVVEGRAGTAGKPAQPGQQPPAPPQQTPEQKLADIRSGIDALAKKFDDGEITFAEYTRQQRELANQEYSLREEAMLTKVKSGTGEPKPDLSLERATVELEGAHPWVGIFEEVGSEADWSYLRALADENLAARGIKKDEGNPIWHYERRKAISEFADEYGPGLLTSRATKAGVAIPGQTAPTAQPQPKPPLSDAAQARAAKLALAAGHPPDLTRMTNAGGSNTGDYSDARIENMTDDEIGALPDATRRKLLGITA